MSNKLLLLAFVLLISVAAFNQSSSGTGPTPEYNDKGQLRLPEQYREVVALCDLEEMSYADAAVLLECSPGTVASRLHRARSMLKTKLSFQKCMK